MKKLIMGLALSSLILVGCSSTNVNSSSTPKEITWKYGGSLPAPKGFTKQYGVAGPLAGSLEDYIVVAGGANFPYKPVLEGGAKKNYPDLYMLKDNNGKLEVIAHKQLASETGYGASVTTENGIYYIGGTSDKAVSNEILLLTLNKDKKDITVSKVGELPFTFHSGTATYRNEKLYIVAGKQDGKDSNNFYQYDLVTKQIEALPNFPGEKRAQPISQILKKGNKEMLFVFSGGSNIAYTDGYAYDFDTKQWQKAADVKLNGYDISLLGASSVKLNESELLVVGGFNKTIYDDAVKNLGTLKDKQLQEFKTKYFTTDPQDFNWNKNILIFNANTNSWKTIGEVPFNAPCGEGLILIGNKIYSINGEIKPGVRSERMYIGTITN